jgi:hypothetical protein
VGRLDDSQKEYTREQPKAGVDGRNMEEFIKETGLISTLWRSKQ